jgi:aryl-alcohol dehydrogenase-like predicted oxidoreductase
MQVALSWLLHRSPTILLIPGTSSPEPLRENLKTAQLDLPEAVRKEWEAVRGALGE